MTLLVGIEILQQAQRLEHRMSLRSLPGKTNQRAQKRSHGTHAIDQALAHKLGPGGWFTRTVRREQRLQLPENPLIGAGRVRDNRTQ
jgi:hypothetical protein